MDKTSVSAVMRSTRRREVRRQTMNLLAGADWTARRRVTR